VCKVLRLHFSPLELPILLATAHSGEAEALAALEKGVNDFLLKPLRLMELQARINSQVGGCGMYRS
jgi:DNA-binding response OmpR family regulator